MLAFIKTSAHKHMTITAFVTRTWSAGGLNLRRGQSLGGQMARRGQSLGGQMARRGLEGTENNIF